MLFRGRSGGKLGFNTGTDFTFISVDFGAFYVIGVNCPPLGILM
jgi:hypothetical protein